MNYTFIQAHILGVNMVVSVIAVSLNGVCVALYMNN